MSKTCFAEGMMDDTVYLFNNWNFSSFNFLKQKKYKLSELCVNLVRNIFVSFGHEFFFNPLYFVYSVAFYCFNTDLGVWFLHIKKLSAYIWKYIWKRSTYLNRDHLFYDFISVTIHVMIVIDDHWDRHISCVHCICKEFCDCRTWRWYIHIYYVFFCTDVLCLQGDLYLKEKISKIICRKRKKIAYKGSVSCLMIRKIFNNHSI